jgi:branched-chain amino acid transport system permease protein
LGFVNGIVFGSLLALTAIGLSLIYGVLEIPNFAQGEFAALGGFLVFSLVNLGVGLIPSAAIALTLVLLAGIGTERFIIGKLYDRDRFFLLTAFVTFGLTLAVEDVLRIVYGSTFIQIPAPDLGTVTLLGVSISRIEVLAAIISATLFVLLYYFTRSSYLGMAMRAVAEDKAGAQIVGVDTDRIYMFTFGIGALITGFTGILYGIMFSLSPSIGLELTVFAFVIVVVGGTGDFLGTFLASIAIALIESFTTIFVGSQYRLFLVFAILVVALVVPSYVRGGVR